MKNLIKQPDSEIVLPEAFFEFIDKHKDEDSSKLIFRFSEKSLGFDLSFAVLQIECRKKYFHKLNTFIKRGLLFPEKLVAEQSTHEAVAKFHASLFGSGNDILDMTAGLGIDSLYFAETNRVTACDLDKIKTDILALNAKHLGRTLEIINTDSVDFLKKNPKTFDIIFIDPSRRDNQKNRLYHLHDCQPDILAIHHLLREKSRRIFAKISPMVDISLLLKEVPDLTYIAAISVKGECKELLLEMKGKRLSKEIDTISSGILFDAIDLEESGEIRSRFSFIYNHSSIEPEAIEYLTEDLLKPGMYIYESNASVMKLCRKDEIFKRFDGIKKLDKSSELYASSELIGDFPGRKLKIEVLVTKENRKSLKGLPANVVSRNYPLSPEEIRSKYGIKEGKDLFLFATKIEGKPKLILTRLV